MECFAERLKAARLARGWSRRDLASKSTLHEQHLAKIEHGGRKRLEADTIIKLAHALGVTSDYLLGLTPVTLQLTRAAAGE